MKLSRIGNKIINSKRIEKIINKVIALREKGYSQTQVAKELGVERTFISRLESIGEVRKGKKIALIGFPIKNKEEIIELGRKYGLDYLLVMTEEERWSFLENKDGLELFNEVIEIIVKLKEFDLVIFLGSNMRLDLIEKLVEGDVVGIELGKSPIKEDKYVDVSKIEELLQSFIE
ncbi:MAG: helix-turn-helix domain-containing protein [Halanaerobiaceae bacterium]|jgi:transcriptional regulator with XRE-family HTH domain|nr:helix-turn-helix domain-containing protein [Halanaerobiaceae bacterium]